MDDFDVFKERMLGTGNSRHPPHRRALLFVDNSGADIVLGMLPLAHELLRRGTEVSSLSVFQKFYSFCIGVVLSIRTVFVDP